ncbi:AraC family transcriptional regulator [Chitinibacter sp. FCG-7]|uniref:AraC family transcriptional regulator n=1 Tax=Chitinibacter mangrovi TaxID=3153927 RepID=A0AAU7FE00_9NEIS
MKASYEVVSVAHSESWSFFTRHQQSSLPFNWHYHPEYELSLVLNAKGQRYIGDHIAAVHGHDLVLTGPNLPHTWAVSALNEQAQIEVRVIWFTHEWLAQLCQVCPECTPLLQAFAQAQHGLLYSAATLAQVQPLMEEMLNASMMNRLVLLFKVLQLLAQDTPTPLSAATFSSPTPPRSEQRLNRVTQYLLDHYDQPLDLVRLAQLANLSANSLCRSFKQHTRMTLSDYLSQLRIARACEALIEGQEPISVIAYRVGYTHLTHFNRQFKRIKQLSPSEFRARFNRESDKT